MTDSELLTILRKSYPDMSETEIASFRRKKLIPAKNASAETLIAFLFAKTIGRKLQFDLEKMESEAMIARVKAENLAGKSVNRQQYLQFFDSFVEKIGDELERLSERLSNDLEMQPESKKRNNEIIARTVEKMSGALANYGKEPK